jgi:hypothetical protein
MGTLPRRENNRNDQYSGLTSSLSGALGRGVRDMDVENVKL